MRYFLVDRITAYTPEKEVLGIKNITLSDEVLHDHFPDFPIMPGSLLIEALAQLSGFLLEMSYNTAESICRAILVQIDRAKFYDTAKPGDQVVLNACIDQKRDDAVKVRAKAMIADTIIVRAGLTFVLQQVDSKKVHEQRRYIYKLWTKHLDPLPKIL